jgi:hypothetical protein
MLKISEFEASFEGTVFGSLWERYRRQILQYTAEQQVYPSQLTEE